MDKKLTFFIWTLSALVVLSAAASEDLESTFYPSISGPADSCAKRERTCLFDYVSKLEARNALEDTTNLRQAACQYLAEYVNCRHENDCTDKDKLMDIVEDEQTRMNVACVIPALVDSYDFEKCANAAGQCKTLAYNVDNQGICVATEKVVDCIGELNCAPDVYLLLWKSITEAELADRGVSDCDVDSFYAKYLPSSSACDQGLNNCATDYLEKILAIDRDAESPAEKRTSICQELNKFIICKQNVTSCDLDNDDLEDLVTFEKARIRVSECDVTIANNGAREIFSVSVTALIFLTILVVNLQNFISL